MSSFRLRPNQMQLVVAAALLVACRLDRGHFGPDALDAAMGPDGGPDSSVDAPPADVGTDAPCIESCAGSTLVRCESGVPVTETCTLGCTTDPIARCLAFKPSNVRQDLFSTIDAGAGAIEIASTTIWDTSQCATLPQGSVVAQGPQELTLCVVRAPSVTISAPVVLTGPYPLVVLASGGITITEMGSIVASATLDRPGPGGGLGGPLGSAGGGRRGGQPGTTQRLSSLDEGGGGGGGSCFGGGAGGNGAMSGVGGVGGEGFDAATYRLEPLRAGSGGGAGGAGPSSGVGGPGGGALQLSAGGPVVINGAIIAWGGGGSGGLATPPNVGAGGGGGGGGNVLIESSQSITIGGMGVQVEGAGGGGAAGCPSDCGGTDGTSGTGPVQGGPFGNGCTNSMGSCTNGTNLGAAGGDGGTSGPGGPGGSTTVSSGGGGGGGGGSGCVVLRAPNTPTKIGTGIWYMEQPHSI